MAGTDKDERCKKDIDDRVVGDKNQHTMSVRTEPDMVLGYEELHMQLAKPGKEAGVARSDKPSQVTENGETDDRNKGDIGMNLITVQLVLADE